MVSCCGSDAATNDDDRRRCSGHEGFVHRFESFVGIGLVGIGLVGIRIDAPLGYDLKGPGRVALPMSLMGSTGWNRTSR